MAREEDVLGEGGLNEVGLKALWQTQEEEGPVMAIEDIRRHADTFGAQVRRRNLTEYVAGAVVIVLFGGFAVVAKDAMLRASGVAIVLGCALVMWLMWRRASAGAAPADAAAADLMAFHKGELARQRDMLAWVPVWYLGPLVPGMALFYWGIARLGPVKASLWIAMAVSVAVFAGVAALNLWAARGIQRQIDELG